MTVAAEHTPGPWQVVVTEHPHHLGGKHTQRRIATAWIHGQLNGPAPVVNLSTGLGATEGASPINMVWIKEADARLIATSPELLDALQDAMEALAMCQPRTDHGARSQSAAMQKARVAIAKAKGELS